MKEGKQIAECVGILAAASLLGFVFEGLGFAVSNIITIYVLAVLIISVVAANRFYSLVASLVSVLVFNFLFTEPRFTLRAYDKEYPVTFLIMFAAGLLMGTLTIKLKNNAKEAEQAAFRTQILLDTSQLMQQAQGKEEILSVTAHQLLKLLNRDIFLYPAKKGQLKAPVFFPEAEDNEAPADLSGEEREAALQALEDGGFSENSGMENALLSPAGYRYLAIVSHDTVYGVVGIAVGQQPVEPFENSIILSILGESALALENEKNAREKEAAAVLAQNEQLRGDLLRAISHDLRTPLTSIVGNASNLISNEDSFDAETRKGLYQDIYEDSMWLINLVENLLSVTRLEEGRLNLHLSAELVDEVIKEALRHVNRLQTRHVISTESQDDLLLAKMDAKLIVQVVINLIDNAIKYTPPGSHIHIRAARQGQWAVISVSDDGPGIPDENKKQIFDMFYSGANRIADSRRSLGLGLYLCRTIINAHGGSIQVSDQLPHGAVFTFTLPIEEVELHE